jgi:hypothetical protein
MDLAWGLLLLTGIYPLGRAFRLNRHTTLRPALGWAILAWAAWTLTAWTHVAWPERESRVAPYLALCLTGCAGIAVLGARRPGAGAWNFVVVGLLAVLLRPLLEGLGDLHLEAAHELFLAATLAVPLLNYLPTRLAPAVVSLASACSLEMIVLMRGSVPVGSSSPVGLVAVTPWVAWLALHTHKPARTEFDRLWLAFRDRFGFLWGQRVREQFNQAVRHAGRPVVLHWNGLRPPTEATADAAALLATLRAVLKRFATDEEGPGE